MVYSRAQTHDHSSLRGYYYPLFLSNCTTRRNSRDWRLLTHFNTLHTYYSVVNLAEVKLKHTINLHWVAKIWNTRTDILIRQLKLLLNTKYIQMIWNKAHFLIYTNLDIICMPSDLEILQFPAHLGNSSTLPPVWQPD